MPLQADRVRARRLATDALALSLALVLSYLESLVPLSFILPGLKLGLANVAVMFVFYQVGRVDAAAVSLLRVTVVALLFGSASSFLFALGGAVLSYLALLALSLLGRRIGRVGLSVGAAAAHVTGQILAAILLWGTPGLLGYLPWLLLGSLPLGTLCGILLIFCEARLTPWRK